MSYQVLARKYRPQKFSEVIGQEHVTRTLQNAIEQKRIAHGYIFSGHRGIGKTTIARILAMALNCRATDNPNPEPCGVCESCKEVRASGSVDVIEIDAATNRGIDEIRELRDAARYRPARDRYKIYILDEAHQITETALNALLKTLEEPPDHVIFMMATTQPEDIPQTIRSRCQHFSFHAVSFDDIVGQLQSITGQEGIRAEQEALAVVAEGGDGSMRDALSIMDQAIAGSGIAAGADTVLTVEKVRGLVGALSTQVFEDVMNAVAANSSADALKIIDRLLVEGTSPGHFARQFVRFLRNTLIGKIAGAESPLLQVSSDERNRVGRVAGLFSEEDLTRFMQLMLRTYDDIGYRQEQRFHLELGVLKMVHAQRLLPLEEILSQGRTGALSAPSAVTAAANRPATPAAKTAAPASSSTPARSYESPASTSTPATRPVSPFEADRSRKGVIKAESQQEVTSGNLAMATAPALQPSIAPIPAPVVAVQVEETPAPVPAAANLSLNAEQLQNAVASSLESQGQRTLADLVDAGTAKLAGEELEISVPTGAAVLDMSMTPEAKRIMNNAASTASGQPLKVKLVAGGSAQKRVERAPRNGNGGGSVDKEKALEEPLVKRMQEKFGAHVLKVIN